LRFAQEGEEQTISEHKRGEKAIEVSREVPGTIAKCVASIRLGF
jgi:hypothetical protein